MKIKHLVPVNPGMFAKVCWFDDTGDMVSKFAPVLALRVICDDDGENERMEPVIFDPDYAAISPSELEAGEFVSGYTHDSQRDPAADPVVEDVPPEAPEEPEPSILAQMAAIRKMKSLRKKNEK